MLTCYRAVVELDHPDSAVHAAEILDHHAELHAAVARPVAGQPVLVLTVPADSLGYAVQSVLSLLRATGHRPLRYQVRTSDQWDGDQRPGRRGSHGRLR